MTGGLLAIGDGVFGSTFYTLTPASELAVDAISYYWRFVDVVWLFLFTTVYVL